MSEWQSTPYPGVRFREHPVRKHNGKSDRYFSIRYRLNGKLQEEGVGFASEGMNPQKASIILAELKKNQISAEGPQTLSEKRNLLQEKRQAEKEEKERAKKEAITFSHVFSKQYFPLAKQNKTKRSFNREESLFRLWLDPVIAKMALKDIRPFHLEKIKKHMADKGQSPRSVRYALAVARQVFNFAKNNNLFLGENPTSKVKFPQADNRRDRFLSVEEANKLLDALKTKSRQLYELAFMSLYSGARAGEIFSLTWGNVDFERNGLTLRDTKNKKTRYVPMTRKVKELLLAKDSGKEDDLVFPARGGGKIEAISKTFDDAVKELGFNEGVTDRRKKLVFHSLRHSCASILIESGESIYVVKELLGHKTILMAERYSHVSNEILQKAVNRLEEKLEMPKEGIKLQPQRN
ncbi:MAG: tyrosine-type recombinase/integrase [Syntrophobacteraceae bacterium]